jgi:hypothetical protein
LIRKMPLLICLIQLLSTALYSDETNEETLARLLKEAVTIFVHSKIVVQEEKTGWESDLKKITIPGRTITLFYETENEKLTIELTPFKMEDGSYVLAAMSNFWHEDSDGVQFRSSFKSIELEKEELILFYPLGLKTQEALTGGSIYMELGIKVFPYKRDAEELTE